MIRGAWNRACQRVPVHSELQAWGGVGWDRQLVKSPTGPKPHARATVCQEGARLARGPSDIWVWYHHPFP